MAYFLAGCAVLVLLIVAGRLLAAADPQKLAKAIRKAGGIAALAAAGFLTIRGALPLAIPLAVFGFALLGKGSMIGLGGPFGSARKTPGRKSQVRTERLEMELDHDSGHMDGKCLTGRFADRSLSSLSDREAIELYEELSATGAQEWALMEAYLDWRVSGWRDKETDSESRAEQARGRATGGRMSAEEAYAVLGVGKGASAEDIRRAHRKLMMKLHPDQGGSTYLAARINEAKEVLLGGRK